MNRGNRTRRGPQRTPRESQDPRNLGSQGLQDPQDLGPQDQDPEDVIDSHLKLSKDTKSKVSLSHLLNYRSYRELEEYRSSRRRPRHYGGGSSASSTTPTTSKTPLSGMAYVNLHYKFIVNDGGNYAAQQLDPNVPVARDDIIQIIAPRGNSCPICLTDDFVAPRMITACGHIICLACLLSLLDTEVPNFNRKDALAVVVKYNDCPLCGSIIRKHETKPVLIRDIDDRFEVPKVGQDTVLTLMSRPHNKLFSVPKTVEDCHYSIHDFPDVTEEHLSGYLRIFKADYNYINAMYDKEIADITRLYHEEHALYQDDGTASKMATAEINKDKQLWHQKWQQRQQQQQQQQQHPQNHHHHHQNHHNPVLINSSNTFFYYETGFNAHDTYVLSPLDIKVLKTNYNHDYSQMPSSLIAHIETIHYEELTENSALKKYKYLSHLPLGTTIGFIECNWYKNEWISSSTWETFKEDLTKRSKRTNQKFKREERNRQRALHNEEKRNKMFFDMENKGISSVDEYEDIVSGNMGSLSIIDNRMPELTQNEEAVESESLEEEKRYETTVWGTKIRSSSRPDDGDWEAEEMIRRAKEEMNKGGKGKKKKKMVLMSS